MPDIFQEAGLPLWLRPYEVLVTSSYTALIETIPDTVILYYFFKSHLTMKKEIKAMQIITVSLTGFTSFYQK